MYLNRLVFVMVGSKYSVRKTTTLFSLLQATGGSDRSEIPDSKGFCRKLFECVESYKEVVGHSIL